MTADFGANVGYIISKAGFQSGAFEASELTNIKLMTWKEFQLEFEEQWYWQHLTKQVKQQLEPILYI
ncbi:hypothetical protein [Pseudovibrio brasiliensis]|uniref:Uncharacterized protein n=1 Tax=Pseudovibrio brasiliensis TaxID=1898042 RepID=A0ABX8ALI8_9HYPH|nr:hypothetical protein [Pseudovibrio brasiliensis]QUS54071.1 hypothetical protein KGB56_11565 [Pseudovibrio brasiliensis]